MHIISITIFYVAWFSRFFFLNVKNFVIHFRYFYQHIHVQSQWQQIINNNFVTELNKTNWYVRNNQKWGEGNIKNVYKLFGVIHFADLIITVFLLFIRNSQDM